MTIDHQDLLTLLAHVEEADIEAVRLINEADFDWEMQRPTTLLGDNELALVLDSFLTYTERSDRLRHQLEKLPPVPLLAGPIDDWII